MRTDQPTATATPRTNAHLAAQPHTYSPSISHDFARTLERELAEAKREATAQGEHAVAMTEYAQQLKAALDVAVGALKALEENDPEENRQHADEIANKALAHIAAARK